VIASQLRLTAVPVKSERPRLYVSFTVLYSRKLTDLFGYSNLRGKEFLQNLDGEFSWEMAIRKTEIEMKE
jgi:hypothetical protein